MENVSAFIKAAKTNCEQQHLKSTVPKTFVKTKVFSRGTPFISKKNSESDCT